MRGFIREVLTIAGVGGGLVAAYFGGPILNPYMQKWFGVEPDVDPERLFGVIPYDVLATVLSYGVIFITVVIVLSVVSHMLAEAARSVGLGAVDRTFGFIFGLVRGILLLGLLYLPVHLFFDEGAKEAWFKDSKTHFYLEKTAAAMETFLPEDIEEEAEKAQEDAEELGGTMRDTLKGIDLLNKDDKQDAETLEDEKLEGYQEDFREQMDELFEEKSEDKNGTLNE